LPLYVLQLGLLPLRENRIFLRDDTGTQIDRDTDGNGFTAAVSAVAGSSGQWSVAVLVRNFNLLPVGHFYSAGDTVNH
jgi:hypothetical protein